MSLKNLINFSIINKVIIFYMLLKKMIYMIYINYTQTTVAMDKIIKVIICFLNPYIIVNYLKNFIKK